MSGKGKMPVKTLIMEGSSRVQECLVQFTYDALEDKARLNEFYRCCVHSWSDKKDSVLWERYSIAVTICSYVDEEGLNNEGWQYVQSKGMQMFGHIAPMKVLKTRLAETRRCQDGSVKVIMDNPTADISHCILY
ncbi:hypothetical protein M5K25_022464 [Dendrobium thyrsiflorum]|uniref:Uncharacterized protein n=1 Tax=Dendrobium thyrsiflorum TaxID=117978 RepID=A0ABD0U6A7_DENTH